MSKSETVPVHKTESIMDRMRDAENSIRARAFEISSGNGFVGRDLNNWLLAQDELTLRPPIELREKDNQFKLEIAVPGVDPKTIDIEVTAEDILVKAELRHEHEAKQGTVHTCEFRSGSLFRAVKLPRKINTDKVKAKVKNGILYLKADIAKEPRTRKAAVQTA